MSSPLRIAFFGGTFDPVHEGHLELAQKAIHTLKLDRILFIPCRRSPHKTEEPGASDSERLDMLRLATASFSWAKIENYELKKPPPSYTWETVQHFKETLDPKTQLFLLIGFDQWNALPRWSNIETLAKLVEFIVVGRDQQPETREGYTAHFIEGNHPAASSQIRSDLKNGLAPRWLPPAVEDYLVKKDLYSITP